MKYMFLLFDENTADTAPPADMAPWNAFFESATKLGTQVSGQALQSAATATVVSVRGSKRVTTDGPFIETKEQLGGFFVFDCENLDLAIELAAQVPTAVTGHVEVRPVFEFE